MGQGKVSGHGRFRLNESGKLNPKTQNLREKRKKELLSIEQEMDANIRLTDPNFRGIRLLGEELLEYIDKTMDGMSLDERSLFMRMIKDDVKKAK